MMRIVLIDGEYLSSLDVRALLRDEGDFEIVAEADHSSEAIVLALQHRPDVVLLDTDLPPLEAARMTSSICRALPETMVLVVCSAADKPRLRLPLEAGARGCVIAPDKAGELSSALRGLINLERSSASIIAAPLKKSSGGGNDQGLRARELEILEMISVGRTNRQIAESLHLTPGTVRVYVSAILRRMGAGNRTEAAFRAIDMGIIRPFGRETMAAATAAR